jgi:hypothetical protein
MGKTASRKGSFKQAPRRGQVRQPAAKLPPPSRGRVGERGRNVSACPDVRCGGTVVPLSPGPSPPRGEGRQNRGASRRGWNAGLVPRAPGNPAPAPRSLEYAPHSPEYASHSLEYAPHSLEYAPHSSEYALHSLEYAPHSPEYASHSSEYALHSSEYTPHFSEYAPYSRASEPPSPSSALWPVSPASGEGEAPTSLNPDLK